MPSPNDIVPQGIQNALMYLRDQFRVGYFYIGDQANYLVKQSAVRGFAVTQQQVFDAVGQFCGKSGRTVRYYAETAAFYTEETREKYDALPFSHFVMARSLAGSFEWDEVLDYAMEHPNITAEGLRHAFVSHVRSEDRTDPGISSEDSQFISDDVYPAEECALPSSYQTLTVISGVMEGLNYLERMVEGGQVKLDREQEFLVRSGVKTLRAAIKVLCAALGLEGP